MWHCLACSVWNEAPCDPAYVKELRHSLDAAGFADTKIVAQDGGAQICNAMKTDSALAKAIDIIGLHYPSDFFDLSACDALGKPVWASEESSSYDDLCGRSFRSFGICKCRQSLRVLMGRRVVETATSSLTFVLMFAVGTARLAGPELCSPTTSYPVLRRLLCGT